MPWSCPPPHPTTATRSRSPSWSGLDPTAIADNRHYSASDIEHLYVRRHRGSPEVAAQIGDRWRERAQPQVRPVTPTPAERAVLEELDATWLHPASGVAPVTGNGRTLFPWTLFKGFLSSPPRSSRRSEPPSRPVREFVNH